MSKGTLNKVQLIGRLGRDPELRFTANGQAVATLNLATNESYKDKDGSQVDLTDWHHVIAWRKLAEICGQYLKKGSLVYVEGKLKTRSYSDKQGQKRYVTEIVADVIQILHGVYARCNHRRSEPQQMWGTDKASERTHIRILDDGVNER